MTAPGPSKLSDGAKRFVRMFKSQFADLVAVGIKTQTVRPKPARMPKVGDLISLRKWEGSPYRSKQRVLREAKVVNVHECVIDGGGVWLDGKCVDAEKFARCDGFKDFFDLKMWFYDNHGSLPFAGIAIFWEPALLAAAERPAGDK